MVVMLDPRLKDRLAQGYAKIGDITYKIALNLKRGKDHIPAQRALYEQGIKMNVLLKVLFRHIKFNDDGTIVLYRITEEQVNKLVRCLVELGELDQYPIVPTALPNVKPILVTTGEQGEPGQDGQDGSDANIIVEPEIGEDQISVNSVVIDGVRHDRIKFTAYVAAKLTAAIQGSKVFEIGTNNNITINLTSTKGTKTVLTLICSTDSDVNLLVQAALNLTAINGLSQPVLTQITVNGQTNTETFNFQIFDGKTVVNSSDSVSFFYTYLYGTGDTSTLANYYTMLTKLIAGKADRSFLLNGSNKYFFIGFDQGYGPVTIFDQNGFDKTADFTLLTVSVTSTGLASNYTRTYRIYRTTLKTTIINALYTIKF